MIENLIDGLFSQRNLKILLSVKVGTESGGKQTTKVFLLPKSAFLVTSPPKLNSATASMIWNFRVPKKVKVFLSTLFYWGTNTTDKIQKKLPHWSLCLIACVLCWQNTENVDHRFLHCPFAAKAWHYVASLMDFSFCLPQSIDDFITEGFGGNSLKGKAYVL